jgi:hypothetical protein
MPTAAPKTKPAARKKAAPKTKAAPKPAPKPAPKTKPAGPKRRLRSLPWAAAESAERAKRYYGGAFPVIRGRKYTYPPPEDEEAWMRLVRAAVAHAKERNAALAAGREPPACADGRIAYIAFHARPREIKRRSTRVAHRAQHGLAVGDPRQVHHLDPARMRFSRTVVLTHCQHKRRHGQVCDAEKPRAKRN